MVKATRRGIPLSFTILICLGILLGCGKKDDEETQATTTPVVVATPAPVAPMNTDDQAVATSAMSKAQSLSISQNCLEYFQQEEVRSSVASSLSAGSYNPMRLMSANVKSQRPRGMRGAYSPEHLDLLNQSILCINELNRIATILHYFQQFYAPGAVNGYLGQVLNRGYSTIGNGVGIDPLGGM